MEAADRETIKELLEEALLEASSDGDASKVRRVLKTRCLGEPIRTDVRRAGQEPLHFACSNGKAGIVRMLLAANANPNAKSAEGCTPLHLAANNTNSQVIKLLLKFGADMNARDDSGDTPLIIAARKNHPTCAKVLIQAGADVSLKNESGQGALDVVETDLLRDRILAGPQWMPRAQTHNELPVVYHIFKYLVSLWPYHDADAAEEG